MPKITIEISDNEKKILEKRAKENLLSLSEQIEDIVRRSTINYKENSTYSKVKPDDRLVQIFSREVCGRKKKKK